MRIMLFILLAITFSCTNESGARQALLGAGYDDIEFRGHSWQCGRDDSTCTEFTATGPSGREVHGAVGCGYSTGCSKGCTIRTF